MTALYIACGIVAAALIAAFAWFSNNALTVTRVSVHAPENLKIVHISDLHGKRFGRRNAKLVKKIVALSPDVIAVTGDIIHTYTRDDRATALYLVNKLSKIAPVYFVSGNHEMRNKGYRYFRAELSRAGAVILDDDTVTFRGITFSGLNCASLRNDRVFKVMPESFGFKALLAHEPQYFGRYARAGADLVLCGHAHGGQWRIPFTRIGLYAPGQGLFPKYTSGLYRNGKTVMSVSRGLGNSQFPLRLFNRPEITEITLSTVSGGCAQSM